MKKAISLVVVLALCLSLYSCADYDHRKGNDVAAAVQELPAVGNITSGCKAEYYTMDITLDTEDDIVYGTTTVQLSNKTTDVLSEICFRLYSANISSGEITSAQNAETGNEYGIRVEKDPSVIYISLDDDLHPGETVSVALAFESAIPLIGNRYGHFSDSNGELYNLTFCFPQAAFLEDGQWHEDAYFDSGETYYYEMTDYHVTFHAPADYVVMASGKSQTVDGVTVIEAPNVREMAITACNFAEVYTAEANGITINLLGPVFSAYSKECLADLYEIFLALSADALEIYSEAVGPYIYDELDVIPTYYDNNVGGMEMPGLVQVGMWFPDENSQLSFYDYLNSVTALVHEIGHQWFYCAVGNNTSKEPWLDEAFTSYLDRLYFCASDLYPSMLTSFAKKHDRDYDPDFPGENGYIKDALSMFNPEGFLFISEFDAAGYVNLPVAGYSNGKYGILVYANGAWLLRELELCMGTEDFSEMIGDWYEKHNGGIVTGSAFIMHLLKYDSSDEVKAILNEYLSDEHI